MKHKGGKMKERNTIPVKKNGEYIVEIIDNGFEGEGIAKIENYTIFIENAIKGEIYCKSKYFTCFWKNNRSSAAGSIQKSSRLYYLSKMWRMQLKTYKL